MSENFHTTYLFTYVVRRSNDEKEIRFHIAGKLISLKFIQRNFMKILLVVLKLYQMFSFVKVYKIFQFFFSENCWNFFGLNEAQIHHKGIEDSNLTFETEAMRRTRCCWFLIEAKFIFFYIYVLKSDAAADKTVPLTQLFLALTSVLLEIRGCLTSTQEVLPLMRTERLNFKEAPIPRKLKYFAIHDWLIE